ncbi:hypothetical protein K491DRAFT_596224 [Lophiostoma macrostomum CBS 122681]|uniref:BZIP domain-containing protein n=1 Tax=Lophiostoma macrostomum CBS 122681 TaxID=1314788 RepID=A0A6A6TD36_9PLEO|nr:hypothetical protein K491DRAFT_596224 [Lophiostoma macrostomum CBS 122681]
MSGYNGRPAPNVSRYIADLNTVPSRDEPVDSPPTNLEAELALFTNNEFMDWDGTGVENPYRNPSLDLDLEQPVHSAGVSDPKMDFTNLSSNFEFADFGLPNTFVDPSMQTLPSTQSNPYGVPATFSSPVDSAVSPVTPGFELSAAKKRKLDNVDPNSQQAIDEAARVAAEEDKRRRNTAASARFRVKKKQREQALEKTAKEMSDRVNVLESRIQQLETENTWLKGLITEKNNGKSGNTDFTAMLKKHVEDTQNDRISTSRTDGVGTKSEASKA